MSWMIQRDEDEEPQGNCLFRVSKAMQGRDYDLLASKDWASRQDFDLPEKVREIRRAVFL